MEPIKSSIVNGYIRNHKLFYREVSVTLCRPDVIWTPRDQPTVSWRPMSAYILKMSNGLNRHMKYAAMHPHFQVFTLYHLMV